MRKLFSLFLALVATTSLWAQTFQVGDLYYKITSSSAPYTVEVSDAVSSITTAIIPETVTYNGTTYSVTSIGDYAFWYCFSLTSVTIPNSVTSIGAWAFSSCSSLTSVTIPNSVTSIGNYAFDYCSSLTSVTINSDAIVNNKTYSSSSNISDIFDSQVTEYIIGDDVKGIGDWAFCDCSSLTSITIPNSVTSIGDWAFASCYSLTSVTIPNSVKSIGDGVFYGCCSLTSVTIPNSVTSIGDQAFDGCSSLTSITIPNSVTSIGEEAFRDCSSLTSVTLPNSITNIGNKTFQSCDSLTSITIPNSVISIGDEAFLWCSSLTSITIGNSVTSIGYGAFWDCSSLTSITIPNSVTSIGYYAFFDCSSLDTLTCLAMTPPALEGGVFLGCDNPTLFVPCTALSDYQVHEQWGQFTTIECIASEETETEEVVVESGTTTVTITWPTEEGADTYTIVIKKDGEVVCTLTFNSEGQLISIAFAPGRDGNHPAQYAEQISNGYSFIVTGLDANTTYTYDVIAKDSEDNMIVSHIGEFTTLSNVATSLCNIQSPSSEIRKLLRNGQLIILRDGVEYNAMGQEL